MMSDNGRISVLSFLSNRVSSPSYCQTKVCFNGVSAGTLALHCSMLLCHGGEPIPHTTTTIRFRSPVLSLGKELRLFARDTQFLYVLPRL
jgi:hypothetical protein